MKGKELDLSTITERLVLVDDEDVLNVLKRQMTTTDQATSIHNYTVEENTLRIWQRY